MGREHDKKQLHIYKCTRQQNNFVRKSSIFSFLTKEDIQLYTITKIVPQHGEEMDAGNGVPLYGPH